VRRIALPVPGTAAARWGIATTLALAVSALLLGAVHARFGGGLQETASDFLFATRITHPAVVSPSARFMPSPAGCRSRAPAARWWTGAARMVSVPTVTAREFAGAGVGPASVIIVTLAMKTAIRRFMRPTFMTELALRISDFGWRASVMPPRKSVSLLLS